MHQESQYSDDEKQSRDHRVDVSELNRTHVDIEVIIYTQIVYINYNIICDANDDSF